MTVGFQNKITVSNFWYKSSNYCYIASLDLILFGCCRYSLLPRIRLKDWRINDFIFCGYKICRLYSQLWGEFYRLTICGIAELLMNSQILKPTHAPKYFPSLLHFAIFQLFPFRLYIEKSLLTGLYRFILFSWELVVESFNPKCTCLIYKLFLFLLILCNLLFSGFVPWFLSVIYDS